MRWRNQRFSRRAMIGDVECGSSGGVVVSFDRLEVVYRLMPSKILDVLREYSALYAKTLIHDRVRSEMNAVCNAFTLQEVRGGPWCFRNRYKGCCCIGHGGDGVGVGCR